MCKRECVLLVEVELTVFQDTLLLSSCHVLVWGRRRGFASPLVVGRIGCRNLSMHTRCRTDLFWKDFQKTLFCVAEATILAKRSSSRKKEGQGRRGVCHILLGLLQEKVFWKEKQTFHSRRLPEAVWNSIIHSCFIFHEQVKDSFVVNRG